MFFDCTAEQEPEPAEEKQGKVVLMGLFKYRCIAILECIARTIYPMRITAGHEVEIPTTRYTLLQGYLSTITLLFVLGVFLFHGSVTGLVVIVGYSVGLLIYIGFKALYHYRCELFEDEIIIHRARLDMILEEQVRNTAKENGWDEKEAVEIFWEEVERIEEERRQNSDYERD